MTSLYTRSRAFRPRLRVALATALALIVLFPAAALAGNFVGGPGPDVINGTSGADNIVGLGGNDTINAGGGDDNIYGGTGDDVINCGAGANDRAVGGPGADTFSGCETFVQ
ncbi:MAG: calcium-binding protein [Egibacteraceae bacterium]